MERPPASTPGARGLLFWVGGPELAWAFCVWSSAPGKQRCVCFVSASLSVSEAWERQVAPGWGKLDPAGLTSREEPGEAGPDLKTENGTCVHTGFFGKGEELREKAESPAVPSTAGGLPLQKGREGGPHGP